MIRKITSMIRLCIMIMLSIVGLSSCDNNQQTPPVNLEQARIVKVPYIERGGVKVIPVKLNGVSMDMIYDSGCTGIHLSMLELQQLYKQGCFSESDFVGTSYSSIADGSIVENGVIMLHSVEVAPGIVLKNVEATVSLNQDAPLLLGNSVLDKVASKIEVDNVGKTINFTRR